MRVVFCTITTFMEKISCPVCGTYNETPFITDHDRLHGIAGTFTLVKCSCQTVYLFPMMNEEELSKYYPDDYLPHRPHKSIDTLWRHRRLKRFVLRWYYGCPLGKKAPPKILRFICMPVSWILSKSTMKSMIHWHGKGYILDVGCGNGGWLLRLKAAGWCVHGVEMDAPAVDIAHKADIPVHCGTLLNADLPHSLFDVIRLHYVFEHIPNPNETLEEIRRIMAEGGKCFIRVPNIKSLTFALFKKYWFPLDLPRHVIHYTPSGMKKIAGKHGLKVTKVTFNSPPTGFFTSIDYMKKESAAPWYFRMMNGENTFWRYLWMPLGWLIDRCHRGDIVEYTLEHKTSTHTSH